MTATEIIMPDSRKNPVTWAKSQNCSRSTCAANARPYFKSFKQGKGIDKIGAKTKPEIKPRKVKVKPIRFIINHCIHQNSIRMVPSICNEEHGLPSNQRGPCGKS